MADPARGFVQHLSEWIFQPVFPSYAPNDGQGHGIRPPICVLYPVCNFARCAASQWRPPQHSRRLEAFELEISRDCNSPEPETAKMPVIAAPNGLDSVLPFCAA